MIPPWKSSDLKPYLLLLLCVCARVAGCARVWVYARAQGSLSRGSVVVKLEKVVELFNSTDCKFHAVTV